MKKESKSNHHPFNLVLLWVLVNWGCHQVHYLLAQLDAMQLPLLTYIP
jgi:hypothetical protein